MGVNGRVYYGMSNDKIERLPRWLTAYLENRLKIGRHSGPLLDL